MRSSAKLELSLKDLIIDEEKELGEGSSSRVYLGTYQKKLVAVKVARSNSRLNITLKDSVHWLEIEDEVLGQLANNTEEVHTGLVGYYGAWFDYSKNDFFIAIEYANAGTLKNWIFKEDEIKDLPNFNWGLAYRIVYDVAMGLYWLHKFNFIHGDIKPANILLNKEAGQLHGKICDFGFTKSVDKIGKDETYSPIYTAPEVLLKYLNLHTKSDIYSFACVLFEIAKQAGIYESFASLDSLKDYITAKNYRENIPSDTPKKIAHLITWGWEKEPENRPTAERLKDELSTPMENISEELEKHTPITYR